MEKHWHGPESQAAADYVEGRLKDRRLFEEHLDECSRCRMDVEALRLTKGRTRTWEEEEPYQRQRTYRPLFSGLALALPILMVLAGLYLTPRKSPSPPPKKRSHQPIISHWETGKKGKVIRFDGQTVTLGPYTQLDRLQAHKLRLNTGQVRVQEKGQLDIETDQIEIHPIGTDFQVIHQNGLSRVHLYSGKVQVRQLANGKMTTLDSSQPEWPSVVIRPKLPERGYPTAAP